MRWSLYTLGEMDVIYETFFGKDPEHPAIEVMWEKLEATSVFTIKELKRIFARYIEMCDKDKGELAQLYFLQMPEIVHCPFTKIAFEHEAAKHSDLNVIDFTLFVRILSKLSLKTLPTEKVDYLCETLGSAGTGDRLDREDLKSLLLTLYTGTIGDDMIDPIVDSAWNTILGQMKVRHRQKKRNEARELAGKELLDAHEDDEDDQPTDIGFGVDEEEGGDNDSKTGPTISRGEVTTYLSSLDLQNFLTVQF